MSDDPKNLAVVAPAGAGAGKRAPTLYFIVFFKSFSFYQSRSISETLEPTARDNASMMSSEGFERPRSIREI